MIRRHHLLTDVRRATLDAYQRRDVPQIRGIAHGLGFRQGDESYNRSVQDLRGFCFRALRRWNTH